MSKESKSVLTQAAKEKLESLVLCIEALEASRARVADEIKEAYAEANASGYDTKALRKVINFRKQDREKRQEEEMVFETYLISLGEI